MSNFVKLCCLISFVTFSVVKTTNETDHKLIAVIQIMRHGERKPYSFYKTDPYANSEYWKDLGAAKLTINGKRQMFKLGQFTRSRFSDFLPKEYDKNVFRATTTNSDRTHMSGQCFLYGLFPATGKQIWQENVDWQPIPLHESHPDVLNYEPRQCSNYPSLLKDVWNSKKYVDLNEKYQNIFRYLSNHTGENLTDIPSIATVYDNLRTETSAGFKLPKWAEEIYPQPVELIEGYHYKAYSETHELKTLFHGPFFHEILEYFSQMSNNSSSSQKYKAYIVHDTNLSAILNSLGAFNSPFVPFYASSLWIELKERKNSYYINLYIKNYENLKQICLEGCEMDCPLKQFNDYLKQFSLDIDSWNKICKKT